MKSIACGGCVAFILVSCKGSTLNFGASEQPPTIAVTIGASVRQDLGVKGSLQEAVSTSFQPAPWQYQFFKLHPDAGTDLALLNPTPHHIHIQALDDALPWKSNMDFTSAAWDFSQLDTMVPAIVAVDPGAMFQIMPPPFIALNQGNPNLDQAIDDFASYCGYLVQYYNGSKGIVYPADAGVATILHPDGGTPPRISWWGIYGDFNVGTYPLTPVLYERLYDECVTQMEAANGDAGPLHFSAFEFSDEPGMSPDASTSLPSELGEFLASVNGPVDSLSLHMYSTSEWLLPDEDVFRTVPAFASDLKAAYGTIAGARPELTDAMIWVTQNNVNADSPTGGGYSSLNQGQAFVNDPRGTDAFFAAWRPYVFSQLGKAGNRALYHWDYTGGHIDGSANPDTDLQNAEVNYVTGDRLLSYWIDYWLIHMFPSADLLQILEGSEVDYSSSGIEVLATKNPSGSSVVIMVVDFATEDAPDAAPSVRNGKGARRRVLVDASALGPFASGTLRVISDPNADNSATVTAAPVDVSAGAIPVDLPGYGVAFLSLVPSGNSETGTEP